MTTGSGGGQLTRPKEQSQHSCPPPRPDQEETPPKNAKRETGKGKERGEPGRETWVRPYQQAKGRPLSTPPSNLLSSACPYPHVLEWRLRTEAEKGQSQGTDPDVSSVPLSMAAIAPTPGCSHRYQDTHTYEGYFHSPLMLTPAQDTCTHGTGLCPLLTWLFPSILYPLTPFSSWPFCRLFESW